MQKARPVTCLNFESRYSSLYRFRTPEEVADYFYQTMPHLYGLPRKPMPKFKSRPFFASRRTRTCINAYNRWLMCDWKNEQSWWLNFGDPDLVCRNFGTRPVTLLYLTRPEDVAEHFKLIEGEEQDWWQYYGRPLR